MPQCAQRIHAARKGVALDPVGRRAIALPAVVGNQDRLHAGDAARLKELVDRLEVRADLLLTDRLEQLERATPA